MRGKKLAQLIGSLCLVVVVVLGIFLALNLREDNSIFSKDEVQNTEAQAILSKDIERNYPATVNEVVRLFSRIFSRKSIAPPPGPCQSERGLLEAS